MSKHPILVILAAGMGSRYGGLKQIDPVGPNGEIVIDYSLYDAYKAGFRRVVFIIKEEIEEEFKNIIGNRMQKYFDVEYAFQDLNDLPKGYNNPEERIKPWGTSHAILAARNLIDAPFCVINADDFYGESAFDIVYRYLVELNTKPEANKPQYLMVGYELMKTLSKHGHVARGICDINTGRKLTKIVERTKIIEQNNMAFFTEDEASWQQLSEDTTVSMNFWGFDPSLIKFLEQGFPTFLDQALEDNPLKSEYLLPNSVGELIDHDLVDVVVKISPDQWYGVTYSEDKPQVEAAIKELVENGFYNSPVWGSIDG